MITLKNKQANQKDYIWLIADARLVKSPQSELYPQARADVATEYMISDLGRYMLNPSPIEIPKKLTGCEIHFIQPLASRIKKKARHLFVKNKNAAAEKEAIPPRKVMAQQPIELPSNKDEHFSAHVCHINDILRAYDPLPKALSKCDESQILDIIGICEDMDGGCSSLNIRGNTADKIAYMNQFFGQKVGVILNSTHVSNGLFEMRGFDFKSYDPHRSYKLVKFIENGMPKAHVIGPDNKVDFVVGNYTLISYLQILDQAIRENPRFRDSLYQCMTGRATPLKILFNKEFEIDYSKTALPKVYQDIFDNCQVGSTERDVVTSSLNHLQFGIAFSYVPESDSGKNKLYTQISVMHNVRAIEPLKDELPQLYSEINKRATFSEAGHFYLLDSIRGYINA